MTLEIGNERSEAMQAPMASPEPVRSPGGEPALVYDLRRNGDGARYCAEVSEFSGRLLAEIDRRAGDAVRAYGRFVQTRLNEAPRSQGEYAIELLTLGLALGRYARAAQASSRWAVALARWLFRLRRGPAWIKPAADFLRAALIRRFLLSGMDFAPAAGPQTPERLDSLIAWLEASGEFEQEAVRLNNWKRFLDALPQAEAARCLQSAVRVFDWFEREADRALGRYTRGVRRFLAGEYARRGCREDQLFCAKQPVEYHLGMVTAEIMNRGLLPQFERTRRHVVLVPTCMRGARAGSCRARTVGVDTSCSGCDPDCAVNRITQRMRRLGAEVYLVPHSTGFSRWLERWQHEPGVGVTAVACLLNILPGGYEMRARGIASQCVPLDYPGCRKHWRNQAIATSVNEERLVNIVTAPAPGAIAAG